MRGWVTILAARSLTRPQSRLDARPQVHLTGGRHVGSATGDLAACADALTSAAIFLVVSLAERGEQQVRELLTEVSGLARAVGFREPAAGLACVVGIGARPGTVCSQSRALRGCTRFSRWSATSTGRYPPPATSSSTSAPLGWTSASSWPPTSSIGCAVPQQWSMRCTASSTR